MELVIDIGDELSSIVASSSDIGIYDTKVSTITPMQFPTELVPMQCTSCGAAIDKDTMTCKHCGMAFMLR